MDEELKKTEISVTKKNIPVEDLIKKITGKDSTDSSGVFEYLFTKNDELRKKYELPDHKLLFENPNRYSNQLDNLALIFCKGIFDDDEYQQYIPEGAAAVYSPVNNMVLRRKVGEFQDDLSKKQTISEVEHEIIHAVQHLDYPEMSTEEKEFDAYVAANLWVIPIVFQQKNGREFDKNSADDIVQFNEIFFSFVADSVNSYYQRQSD